MCQTESSPFDDWKYLRTADAYRRRIAFIVGEGNKITVKSNIDPSEIDHAINFLKMAEALMYEGQFKYPEDRLPFPISQKSLELWTMRKQAENNAAKVNPEVLQNNTSESDIVLLSKETDSKIIEGEEGTINSDAPINDQDTIINGKGPMEKMEKKKQKPREVQKGGKLETEVQSKAQPKPKPIAKAKGTMKTEAKKK